MKLVLISSPRQVNRWCRQERQRLEEEQEAPLQLEDQIFGAGIGEPTSV